MIAVTELVRRARIKLYGHFDGGTDIVVLHDHGLVYFGVPKVANTSVKVALSELVEPAYRRYRSPDSDRSSLFRDPAVRPRLFRDRVLINKHHVHRYGKYLRATFVRNPWDRLVSCYADKVVRDSTHQAMKESMEQYTDYENGMPFPHFVRTVCRIPDQHANRHFRSQHTFLTDRTGRLMPEWIGRFEHLTDDFSRLCREVGLPDLSLPTFKATKRRDYRDYYTDELRDLVHERYREDIELFGYGY